MPENIFDKQRRNFGEVRVMTDLGRQSVIRPDISVIFVAQGFVVMTIDSENNQQSVMTTDVDEVCNLVRLALFRRK